MPFHLAALISAVLCFAAWRIRAITAGGAVAAFTVGLAVLVGTGWDGGAVLMAFFVTSTAVGRAAEPWRAARHVRPAFANLGPAPEGKGETRDQFQVIANGGAALLGALVGLATDQPALGLRIVTCSLAVAAADTWATSVGAVSQSAPRDILSGQYVPPGASGGITAVGTLGGALGALVVAVTGAVAGEAAGLLGVAFVIGFTGMLLDSVLGASVQGRFRCPACDVETERRRHRCGTRTVAIAGWGWLTNDGVNLVATTVGAMAGWLVYRGG
ncbi:MAG: DUF92 domain-containing protein [Gemmatimonadota bacterium]